jgi:hypothetical protein
MINEDRMLQINSNYCIFFPMLNILNYPTTKHKDYVCSAN